MPSGKDWVELLKSTFHKVGREDIGGLFSQEWKHAKAKLTARDRERDRPRAQALEAFLQDGQQRPVRPRAASGAGAPRRVPRRPRLPDSLVPGSLVLARDGAARARHGEDRRVPLLLRQRAAHRGLPAAGAAARDGARRQDQLPRRARAGARSPGEPDPARASRGKRLRARRAQRDRQHGGRRHLRLRPDLGRAAGRALRRRLRTRDGGGPGHGRRARRVSHPARRGSLAAGHGRDAQPHPLPNRRTAGVLRLRLPPARGGRPRRRLRGRASADSPGGTRRRRARANRPGRLSAGHPATSPGRWSNADSASESCCCSTPTASPRHERPPAMEFGDAGSRTRSGAASACRLRPWPTRWQPTCIGISAAGLPKTTSR